MDFRLDAGGVRMPGGHDKVVFSGAGEDSWLTAASAASSCSRLSTPLS